MEEQKEQQDPRCLSKVEQAVSYFFLNKIFTEQSFRFEGGQKTLAKLIGRHENSVLNAVKSLEERGWLQRTKEHKRNILEFTPPKNELLCRLSYCSGVIVGSYSSIELQEEMTGIVEQLEAELTALQQEAALLEQRQKDLEKRAKQITPQQIIDFVDKLLVRIGNRLDQKTLEEKVLIELALFKQRLRGEKPPKEKLLPSASSNDFRWNKGEVLEGFREIQAMKDKQAQKEVK